MDSRGTQTVATFTGTLLRREHTIGQKFVQLVFREGDKNWLCISSKLTNAKLGIGQTYKIEGIFKQAGDRAYIHEPKIELLKRQGKAAKKRLVIGVVALVAVLVCGGVVFALQGHSHPLTATNVASHTTQQPQTESGDNSAVAPATTADTPATPTDTAATPAAPTVVSKKTTPTANTTPATSSPVATAPVAYCDNPTVISFQSQQVDDAGMPVGTTQVTQVGVNGSQQVCYPDGTPASAQTATTPAVDEITHVGTKPVE
jgi:hypothetical protein